MRAMRAKHTTAFRVGAALGLGLMLTACGPIAFQDTVRYATAPEPEPEPEPKPKRVQVTADHILIDEKIQFDYDSAAIKAESHSILDEVVEVVKENPDISKIHVIGHTSSEGKDSYNKKLSGERAAAVVAYLTEHGIEAGRLSSEGKGESEPIADNDTEEGKEKNRRVEFKIEKGAPAATEAKAPARGRPGGK
jgi:OOP family OmpA-OmpF porin